MSTCKVAYALSPIEFGGAERVNLNFLKYVDRNKFDIYLILLIRPWEKENVFIQKLEKEKYPIYKIPVAPRPRSEGRGFLRFFRCYCSIRSFLKKESFDLLHTHGYFADILGIPAAKTLRIPCISTCHGFISNDRNLKLYNSLDRFVLRFANKIIAVSDGIKKDLLKKGIKGFKLIVIQNAVNENHNNELFTQNRKKIRQLYNINEKEFVLGYIGRLSVEKGSKYLIEASSMLNESGVPIKVLIIGEGPQRKELEDLVKEAGIENRVLFTGFQSDIENWLPAIDIFVLPSITEGTPMALLEAMAFGIPVVASAVGGVPQVIDSGKNGILVTPGNPEEIKDAIYNLYKNEPVRRRISTAARETVRLKYNIKDWTSSIETEYLKILNLT